MQRLVLGLVLLGLLWAIGFALFIGALPGPSAGVATKADGIAVYTGGGGARIEAGMNLFAGGAGKRLLISGVHPDTTRTRLAEFWNGSSELFSCCVDLGREAMTTNGNAAEVGEWAEKNGYNEILLVTSEYHMPRAMVSTRARMPGVVIHPYAVASGYMNENNRPASFKAWKKLAGEYTKYLLAKVRAILPFAGA